MDFNKFYCPWRTWYK